MDRLRQGSAARRSLRGGEGGERAPAILLTGVGKRYDIVACFAALATTSRSTRTRWRPRSTPRRCARRPADRGPRVRARAAGAVRALRGRRRGAAHRPRHRGARAGAREWDPAHPARARALARGRPRDVRQVRGPPAAQRAWDCPRRRRCCPARSRDSYPVMVKPRKGSGARSIHLARDARSGTSLCATSPRGGRGTRASR